MASKQAIYKLQREIFGQLPNKNVKTGHKILKKQFTGILEGRYYLDPIDSVARKVNTTVIVHRSIAYDVCGADVPSFRSLF